MKKILVFSNTSFSIEKFRSHYLNKLAKDFKILVATPHSKPHNLLKPKFKSIKSQNLIFELLKIIKLILIFKPKIIIIYSFKYQFLISILKIFFNFKIIILIAGKGSVFLKNSIFIIFIRNLFLYFIFKQSNKIIFINHFDKKFFFYNFNIKSKSYSIPTEGLIVPKFKKKNNLKSKIIFFGRLIYEKGIFDYIKAVDIIKKKYPFLKFYIAGPTNKNKIGQSMLFKKKSTNFFNRNKSNFIFLGYIKDYKKIFNKMDCLIAPSFTEGAGTSVMEAMVSGLFVIAYKNNGHNFILRNTDNYLCKKNEVKEIVKGISYFLNLKTKFLNQNHKQSYNKVKDNYRSEKIYLKIKKIILS